MMYIHSQTPQMHENQECSCPNTPSTLVPVTVLEDLQTHNTKTPDQFPPYDQLCNHAHQQIPKCFFILLP
jgi:hypothetical protein